MTARRTGGRPAARAGRAVALVTGLGALGFGVQQLVTGGRATVPGTSARWLLAVLAGHDVVVASVAVVAGGLLRRAVRAVRPRRAGRPVLTVVASALFAGAVLAGIAGVELAAPGVPGNATVLPGAYGHGLVVLLVADAVVASLALLVVLLLVPAGPRVRRHRPVSPPRRGHPARRG